MKLHNKPYKFKSFVIQTLALLSLSTFCAFPLHAITTEKHEIDVEIIAQGLDHPWGMAFLPNGTILVTERSGQMRLLNPRNNKAAVYIKGLPDIQAHGQGGLLDVAIHPDFSNNHWVYFSYAEKSGSWLDDKYGTSVARGKLVGNRLEDVEIIFRMSNKTDKSYHFGSRLVFDKQGYLFITLGDRGNRPRAQDLSDHAGSVIRIHDDGRVPSDNPFVGQTKSQPEIYSYGHRNIQGATLDPSTGELWTHEHGPQGGDELNKPEAGKNYGWPIITYGKNYGSGTSIGEGTHKQGMQQPLYYWVPSIAPSGMTFYTGDQFPQWKNNLFVGSLKFQLLVRLQLDGNTVVHEERMLQKKLGRIRDVTQGPDGNLYLLTDAGNGQLIRIIPRYASINKATPTDTDRLYPL